MKKKYEPRIERDPASGLLCQVFRATRVDFGEDDDTHFVQLAEDLGDNTVHSLLFVMSSQEGDPDEAELYVEFNDQGNGLFGPEVGTVELSRDRLVLTPALGEQLGAGRVSYQDDIDPFEGPAYIDGPGIDQVVALIECEPERFADLADALSAITKFGATFRVRR